MNFFKERRQNWRNKEKKKTIKTLENSMGKKVK